MDDSSATPNPAPTANVTAGERIVEQAIARLDLDSRFSMDLRPQPNSLMMAHTVGGMLTNMAELMEAVHAGSGVLMVERFRQSDDGVLSIDFLCARTPAKPSQP